MYYINIIQTFSSWFAGIHSGSGLPVSLGESVALLSYKGISSAATYCVPTHSCIFCTLLHGSYIITPYHIVGILIPFLCRLLQCPGTVIGLSPLVALEYSFPTNTILM